MTWRRTVDTRSPTAQDPKAFGADWLALTLWALGYPDQALTCCAEVEAAAREISHPFSQCFALNAASIVHELRREPEATEKYADALIALAADQGFPFWTTIGAAFRSHSVIQQGKGGSRELAQLRGAIDSLRATGALEPATCAPDISRSGPPAFGRHPRRSGVEPGRSAADAAAGAKGGWKRSSSGYSETCCSRVPTVPRSKREKFYRESIEVARRQEAKSLELQAALALARLWSRQGKRKPALELLQPVYDWFTEGRSTKDHLEAAALLAELVLRPGGLHRTGRRGSTPRNCAI